MESSRASLQQLQTWTLFLVGPVSIRTIGAHSATLPDLAPSASCLSRSLHQNASQRLWCICCSSISPHPFTLPVLQAGFQPHCSTPDAHTTRRSQTASVPWSISSSPCVGAMACPPAVPSRPKAPVPTAESLPRNFRRGLTQEDVGQPTLGATKTCHLHLNSRHFWMASPALGRLVGGAEGPAAYPLPCPVLPPPPPCLEYWEYVSCICIHRYILIDVYR